VRINELAPFEMCSGFSTKLGVDSVVTHELRQQQLAQNTEVDSSCPHRESLLFSVDPIQWPCAMQPQLRPCTAW
jgi:hypothetical protein